jgi:hypothetical protein
MVVEVALHNRLEPFPGLHHWVVHTRTKLLFDFLHLRSHALADGLTLHGKFPVPVFPADVRETQEVERLGLVFSSSFPALSGEPPELDPARFI